jgi:hypothetical protein
MIARRTESVTPERLNIYHLQEDLSCVGAAQMFGVTPSWLESQLAKPASGRLTALLGNASSIQAIEREGRGGPTTSHNEEIARHGGRQNIARAASAPRPYEGTANRHRIRKYDRCQR